MFPAENPWTPELVVKMPNRLLLPIREEGLTCLLKHPDVNYLVI